MKLSKIFGFKGGIHPAEEKGKTAGGKIREAQLPGRVILPLIMSAGKPAKPLKAAGQEVLKYEKIAEADGNFSLPVHSSVSGIVKDICQYMHPLLAEPILSFIIESDGKDRSVEIKKPQIEYFRQSPKDLITQISDAGICGLGGAAFPTHIKLIPPKNREIKTVIVNGCECEPVLTCDEALLLNRTSDIITGLKIIMHILEADKGIIAIEDNKKEAVEKVTKEIAVVPNIEIGVLKTKYPQGGEKQLIQALLNKEVRSDCLPCDVSALVVNVGTCAAITDAVEKGIPLTERVITVSGDNVSNPSNLKVRIGTLTEDVLNQCGYDNQAAKVIMGGPMMGVSMPNLFMPVVKATSGIITFNRDRIKVSEDNDCIRCGRCISVCPMRLFPSSIYKLTNKGLFDDLKGENAADCIECGCCSYVCPSKLYLVQTIRYAKKLLRNKTVFQNVTK